MRKNNIFLKYKKKTLKKFKNFYVEEKYGIFVLEKRELYGKKIQHNGNLLS